MEGTVQAFMQLEWQFRRPVLIGDTVRLRATVREKKPMRRMGGGVVTFRMEVLNQKDEVCQRGNWEILCKTGPTRLKRRREALTAAHDSLPAFHAGVRPSAGAAGRSAAVAGTPPAGEQRSAGGYCAISGHRDWQETERPLRSRATDWWDAPITWCRRATGAGASSCLWRSRAGRGRPGLTKAIFCSWRPIVFWLRTTLTLRPPTACCATPTLRCKSHSQMNCAAACLRRRRRSGRPAVRRRCAAATVSRGAARPAAIAPRAGRRRFRSRCSLPVFGLRAPLKFSVLFLGRFGGGKGHCLAFLSK